eukprot:Tbor_TRINITY_DN4114_c0_g1::TRINITY_DN4114_c0_g1_i1::g.26503::m.26503
MFIGADQTVFTPICSSAEYIGSQIWFDRVPPTYELPAGGAGIQLRDGGVDDQELLKSMFWSDNGLIQQCEDIDNFSGSNKRRGAMKREQYRYRAAYKAKIREHEIRLKDAVDGTAHERFLESCPRLSEISLLHSHIGDEALCQHPIIKAILNSGRATHGINSSVNSTSVEDRALQNLLHCCAIRSLDFSFCSLSIRSIPIVAQIVATLPLLESLTLIGNQFGGDAPILDTHEISLCDSSEAINNIDIIKDEPEGTTLASTQSVFEDLIDVWEEHPTLTSLIFDPWVTSVFSRLEAVRKRKVPLLRKQQLTNHRAKSSAANFKEFLDTKTLPNRRQRHNYKTGSHSPGGSSGDDDEEQRHDATVTSKGFSGLLEKLRQQREQQGGKEEWGLPTRQTMASINSEIVHLFLQEKQERERTIHEEITASRGISRRLISPTKATGSLLNPIQSEINATNERKMNEPYSSISVVGYNNYGTNAISDRKVSLRTTKDKLYVSTNNERLIDLEDSSPPRPFISTSAAVKLARKQTVVTKRINEFYILETEERILQEKKEKQVREKIVSLSKKM